MFEFFRFIHIAGMAMFFGSILAHVATGLIPGAADGGPAMLASRQAITLANWSVTIPGLILAFVSGGYLAAKGGHQKRARFGMHIAGAVAVAAIAAIALIPSALELEAAAKAVADGTMTPDAFAGAVKREYTFGAANIILTIIVIAAGTGLPRQRKD